MSVLRRLLGRLLAGVGIAALSVAMTLGSGAGCGGSGSGSPARGATNVDPLGIYSFQADGWSYSGQTVGVDKWEDAQGNVLYVTIVGDTTEDAEHIALDHKSGLVAGGPTTILFNVTALPGTTGYWYGWVFDNAGVSNNTYEAYFVRNMRALNAELNLPTTASTMDAQTILGTFKVLTDF
jgi:hypothetical protein